MHRQKIQFLAIEILLALCVSCLPTRPVIFTQSVQGALNYTVQLWVSTGCPQPNETITFRAKVTNTGATTEISEAMDQPVFDLAVGGLHWSDGKQLTPELTRLELKPGEFKSIQLQIPYQGSDISATARLIYDKNHSTDIYVSTPPIGRFCPGIGP